MQGRYPDELIVIAEHLEILRTVVRDGHTEQRVAQRARILLLRAEGLRVEEIATRVDKDTSTVWRVCDRYRQRGTEAIYDAPRAGRPRVFSPSGADAHRKPGVQQSERVRAGSDAVGDANTGTGSRRKRDRHIDPLQQHCADLATSGTTAASAALLEDNRVGRGSN